MLRLRAGDRLRATLNNSLPRAGEHVSIHWHGIRLPNAEDGVPYLTQPPVPPGESFTYDFAPPDAGTFFFHTHCNTAEQLGRGMAGVLIVEGDEPEPYDAERLVVLRDWAIGEDGGFGPFLTGEAARAGTFGTVRSCNDMIAPDIAVPAAADVRLRILNIDRTRDHAARHRGRRMRNRRHRRNAGFAVSAEGLVHRPGHAPRCGDAEPGRGQRDALRLFRAGACAAGAFPQRRSAEAHAIPSIPPR